MTSDRHDLESKEARERCINNVPVKYRDWLRSMPPSDLTAEFFERINRRGLVDAVVITLRQAIGYTRPYFDMDDEFFSFTDSSAPDCLHLRFREWASSKQIHNELFENSLTITAILFDACSSDDPLRRQLSTNYLGSFLDHSMVGQDSNRLSSALEPILNDSDVVMRVNVSSLLWHMAPKVVAQRTDLIQCFLEFLILPYHAPEPHLLKAAICIARFLKVHTDDDFLAECQRTYQAKKETDRDLVLRLLRQFHEVEGKSTPHVIWTSAPLDAILCAMFAFDCEEQSSSNPHPLERAIFSLDPKFVHLLPYLCSAICRLTESAEVNSYSLHASRSFESESKTELSRLYSASKTNDGDSLFNECFSRIEDLLRSFKSITRRDFLLRLQQVEQDCLLSSLIHRAQTQVYMPWTKILRRLEDLDVTLTPGIMEVCELNSECRLLFAFDDVCIVLENS